MSNPVRWKKLFKFGLFALLIISHIKVFDYGYREGEKVGYIDGRLVELVACLNDIQRAIENERDPYPELEPVEQ